VAAESVSVLFGIFSVVGTTLKIQNLGYQQVIHSAEIFAAAHFLNISVAI